MRVYVLSYYQFAYAFQRFNVNDEGKNPDDTINKDGKLIAEKLGSMHPNAVFISILDSQGMFSDKHFDNDAKNVVTLQFDDVYEDGQVSPTNKSNNTRAFDESDANKIIDMLEANPDATVCYVHCAAGISRSGAVGQFVNDFYRGDYHKFRSDNPQIHPNHVVVATLNRTMRLK